MNPLFSIITVTYNAADTLPATLQSVDSQTCRLYEHLIIDGASTDNTVALAEAAANPLRRVYSKPDHGLYDAMNKGLGLAKGDYVVFLNAGDAFASPDTLRKLADEMMDNDYPGIVYGQTQIVDADRRKVADRHLTAPEQLNLYSFINGMVVCHQAFFVLRKLTDNFDTRYKYSADYDWCIRCLQRSRRNHYVGDVLIDYLDGGMTTQHHTASLMERFAIMTKYYGLFPTIRQHFKFAVRALRRKCSAQPLS